MGFTSWAHFSVEIAFFNAVGFDTAASEVDTVARMKQKGDRGQSAYRIVLVKSST
jgi:hypothetical protein